MFKIKLTDAPIGCIILGVAFWIYAGVTWLVNLYRFFHCDFSAPWKEEIIRGLGIFLPPVNWITVWMNF